MKARCALIQACLLGVLLQLPASAQYNRAPGFIFVTNNGAITITSYVSSYITGPGGEVDIPDSTNGYPVTGISSNAFSAGNPTSVIIPASITNISEGAFGYCPYLTNIAVESVNPSYTNVGGLLFNKSMTLLLQYPAGLAADNYAIPCGITRIGAYAFSGCVNLVIVTIPDSVTSIGGGAFFYCYSLSNIAIPNGVTSIESYTFLNSGLTSVTIPNCVTNIGQDAFVNCSSLTNVTFGKSIINIGNGAFYGCSSLLNITIPNSVTDISAWAFWNCSSLTNIYFLGNAPTTDSSAFSGDNLATAYYLPNTTGWESFFNATGVPTALWLPQMPVNDGSFGVQANAFGFNINWASGQTVVVEASTDLIYWLPVQTNALTTGSAYFSDPQWTNYPGRFYRLRSP